MKIRNVFFLQKNFKKISLLRPQIFFIPCFLILLLVFLTSCANNNNFPSSPWVSKAVLPGTDWAEANSNASFPPRFAHTSIVYNNKIWLIAGATASATCNDVWYSTNGTNWSEVTASAAFPARVSHTSLVYNNMMWVIAGFGSGGNLGFYNDVWYSTDGTNWSEATANAAFPARHGHASVVFGNKMWVIAGEGLILKNLIFSPTLCNDIWYSTDGTNWSEATANAAFLARVSHTSLVYDNKMWVIAGEGNNNSYYNDVWYSADGTNWSEATANAAFPARYENTSLVYDNMIWVIAGHSANNYNDAWYSTDGANWTQATSNAAFPARHGHASVVFGNKMWVVAGDGNGYLNDVWDSPF